LARPPAARRHRRPAAATGGHRMNTPRIAAAIALAGMLAFLATGIAAQGLRPELDWTRVPNSYYLIGPWGGMVRAGYCSLALALVLLGVSAYRTLSPATRSAAPLLLFVAGGAALALTALATLVPARIHVRRALLRAAVGAGVLARAAARAQPEAVDPADSGLAARRRVAAAARPRPRRGRPMSRWRPPAPRSTAIITRAGFEKLKAELDHLWHTLRPEVVKALAAAAAEGDRSENAEYTYRKKQLGEIDRR